MKNENKTKIHTILPKASTNIGQCTIYAQKYPLYKKEINGHYQLVTPLPIRVSNYEQIQTGTFEVDDDAVTALLAAPGYAGDILCIHTDKLDGAWFFTGTKWKPLKHFKPKDLPWNTPSSL